MEPGRPRRGDKESPMSFVLWLFTLLPSADGLDQTTVPEPTTDNHRPSIDPFG